MSRPTISCAYSIVLHANLGYSICERPHDILHHYHPVFFEILHMLSSQLKYVSKEREAHITETSPFRLPLCGGSFQDLDKLPEILLIPSNCLTDPLELGLHLLQVFALRESSICGVGIQFEAVGFVLLLGLFLLAVILSLMQPGLTFCTCPSCSPLFRYDFSTLLCSPFFKFVSLDWNSAVGCSTVCLISVDSDKWYEACCEVSSKTF